MEKLDKKDFQILFELDRNSRISINELAKKTRLSRDVISYRIKQLEKREIIKSYITIIDFTKFGYQIIRLYLKLQKTTPEIETQIANFFLSQKNILTVYKVDGYYDFSVGLIIKDFQDYQETYERFLKRFRTHTLESHFSIFLDYIHFHRNYLVDKTQHDYTRISTGSFKPFKYDKKDLQLLNLIKENSRMTLLELAERLKMTATGVKYKLKNLEKEKVIVAYKLLLDNQKLGYSYFKVDLHLEDINIIPQLYEFVTNHPNIVYRDIAVGGSDFEFDCEISNKEEFYRLMNKIKSLVPKKIRSYHYIQVPKIYKYSYFPLS